MNKFNSKYLANVQEIINNIRFSVLEVMAASQENNAAKALQAVPFLYTLFRDHLVTVSDGTDYFINDYLVVGKKYGGSLLKTLTFAAGLGDQNVLKTLQLPDLSQLALPKNFYDFNESDDCDALSFATGLAISQSTVNQKHFNGAMGSKVYCVFGQEELTSGKFYEVASFVGRQKLNNLICLVDSSGVDATGFFNNHCLVDYRELIESLGWKYLAIRDGSSLKDISKVIQKSQRTNKPVFIEINTVAAHGSSVAGTYMGWDLNVDSSELDLLKYRFDYKGQPNELIPSGIEDLRTQIHERTNQRDTEFKNLENKPLNVALNDKKILKKEFVVNDEQALINLIVQQKAFDIVLHCSSKLNKFDKNLINQNELITLSGRYLVAPLIAAGIKSAGYLNVALIGDESVFYPLQLASQNPLTKQFNYLTFIITNHLTTNINFDANNIKCIYPYDLASLNKAWMHIVDQEWSVILYPDEELTNLNFELKLSGNQTPKLNIFTLGLNISDMELIKNHLQTKSLDCHLIGLADIDDLRQHKIQISNSAPVVIVSLYELHSATVQSLPFNNKKILVKFNKQSITSICSQLIEISQK